MSFQEQIKASKAIGAGNYDAAIAAYKRILEEKKDDPFALSMLAFCYEWKGQSGRAILYADKVLARFPDNFDMLLISARYWSESDDERAYQFVCRALENTAQAASDFPRWLLWLMKPLAIFKKYRGLEEKARGDATAHKKYKEEHLNWAREYKAWYELKKESE